MAFLGRADEIVGAVVHRADQVAERLADLVRVGLRRQARGLGGFLHLLAVLVGAGEEFDVVAIQPLRPRQNVARNRGVSVPDVRPIVHVIDRRGDVERLGHALLRKALAGGVHIEVQGWSVIRTAPFPSFLRP